MNIAVIGTGYVGLIAACCLAHSGHRVTGVEKNPTKLGKLQRGVMPIYEEDLEETFHKVTASERLTFTSDLGEALAGASVIIIAVGTPPLPDGMIDLSQVNEVASAISRLAERAATVIMKSTVPPGTGRAIHERFFNKARAHLSYVSNPEFLREGKALWDWYHPDRIVIGSDDPGAAERVMELYSDIKAPRICMGITSAEMVKYASNAFLATKISFINEIANLCELVGADIDSVAQTVGMDNRIGPHFLRAGLGYGGSCFPKDTRGLNHFSSFNGYDFKLLKSVIDVNSQQRILAVRKLSKALGRLTDKKIAVLGLAFKPFTDDIREAPAFDIIDRLLSKGARVKACDPKAVENARSSFSTDAVEFHLDPYETCKGCEAVVFVTEWPEFVNLDWAKIKQCTKPPHMLLDGRNALDRETMIKHGFHYMGVGRPSPHHVGKPAPIPV